MKREIFSLEEMKGILSKYDRNQIILSKHYIEYLNKIKEIYQKRK